MLHRFLEIPHSELIGMCIQQIQSHLSLIVVPLSSKDYNILKYHTVQYIDLIISSKNRFMSNKNKINQHVEFYWHRNMCSTASQSLKNRQHGNIFQIIIIWSRLFIFDSLFEDSMSWHQIFLHLYTIKIRCSGTWRHKKLYQRK